MNSIQRIIRSVRNRNLFHTVVNAITYLEDLHFDSKYQIDTVGRYGIYSSDITGNNEKFAVSYSPTRVRAIRSCLSNLPISEQDVFIDLGAGKGRTLFVAAEYGLKKIVGVEFSHYLCDICEHNTNQFLKKYSSSSEISTFHLDVVEYKWQDNETVIYMFNPFSAPIVEKVITNLKISLNRNPRKIFLIYQNPEAIAVINSDNTFKLHDTFKSCGNLFSIFTN